MRVARRLDDLLRILAGQGPFAFGMAFMTFLWWTKGQAYNALRDRYDSHIEDDLRALREARQ